MRTDVLEKRFAEIGARVTIPEGPHHGQPRINVRNGTFSIDFFGGDETEETEIEILDVQPKDRHLLLFTREGRDKSKFLLGHDERDFFVAAIPESAPGVTNVAKAKAALQPPEIQQMAERLKPKHRLRRKNEAFRRQGEWFFVPDDTVNPPANLVMKNEPLTRGGGSQAHVMEFAFRRGGSMVYVSGSRVLAPEQFNALPEKERKGRPWRTMMRDASVYAKGRIRHPDHATIELLGWHRVTMNSEQASRARASVAFLD